MLKRNAVLVLCGILLGCAAEQVVGRMHANGVRAAGTIVYQYCTTTGDFNNVERLNSMVDSAGQKGWGLVGVYRALPMGATHEDYVCFRRD
jgi:hypothetical protein